eukprot:5294328-Heterocapsa_arctica.AAC.1
MERGLYFGKDREHRHSPRHKTSSETGIRQIRCGQIDERGGKEYHPDEEVLQLFRDCVGAE